MALDGGDTDNYLNGIHNLGLQSPATERHWLYVGSATLPVIFLPSRGAPPIKVISQQVA